MTQPNPGAQLVSPLTGTEVIDVLGLEWGTATTAAVADTAIVSNALTAVGTNRATALALTSQINVVSTAASGTGVLLPLATKVGQRWTIYNNGANPIQVYATGSDTIDTVAGATGVTLTNAKRCIYTVIAANTWISAQLGVVSA